MFAINPQATWNKVEKYIQKSMASGDETELFEGVIGLVRLALAFLMIGGIVIFPGSYILSLETMTPATIRDAGTSFPVVVLFVVFYLFWTGRLVYLYLWNRETFQSDGLKNTQIIVDSMFAVGFYILHFQPRSRLYLLLAVIPIVIAGRNYKLFRQLLKYLVLLLASFAGAIWLMHVKQPQSFAVHSTIFSPEFSAVFYVWFPDAIILSAVAIFTYYYAWQKREIIKSRQILQDTTRKLVQETRIQPLATLLCQKTIEIISPAKQKNSTLHLYNPQTQMLELAASFPTKFSRTGALDFQLGQGIAGIALQKLQTINVPNRMEDKRFIPKKEGREYKALLVTPLYVGEKLIGTFSIDSDKDGAFTPDDIQKIEMLSGWASTALANALDFAERRKKFETVQDILLYSQQTLTPQKGIEPLMRDVVLGAQRLLDADDAAVCLFGIVPYQLPVKAVDTARSVQEILLDTALQAELQTYLQSNQNVFLYKYPDNPNRESFSYHIPLIATQNKAIGILSITCEPDSITSKEDSQTMWLFATQAARELEMSLSLEFRKKIEAVVTGFHPPIKAKSLANELQACFQDIGFKRGFVKVHPFLNETNPGYTHFGITNHEARQIEKNLNRRWPNTASPKKGVRIVYVPWKEKWAREHFTFDPNSKKSEQGFFIIRFVNNFRQPIFEIVISVSSQVSLSEKSWKNDLKLYVYRIADTIENVRLASRLAFDRAAKEEREWLQNDIHDTLNILHGGPLLIGEAVQNTLRDELPFDHRDIIPSNGNSEQRQHTIEKIEANLTSMIQGTRFAYDNLNQLMAELRNPTLRDKGLREALLELGSALRLEGILQIDVTQNMEQCLTTEIQYGLYRIGMEAITNAQKHAGILNGNSGRAPKIVVVLNKQQGTLRYSISDNGCGFSVAEKNSEITSFGLRQMKRWARKIHGELTIESTPDAGTTVSVDLKCL